MRARTIAFTIGMAVVLGVLFWAFLPTLRLVLPSTRTSKLIREQWRTMDQIDALNIFDTTSTPTAGQLYEYYLLQIEEEQRSREILQSLDEPINGMEQAIQESKERERVFRTKLDKISK